MRFLSTLALAATAAASAAFAASLPALSSGKVSISTLDGSSRLSGSFSARSGVSALAADEAVRLDSDELIRVAFNVQGDEEESVGAPPQIVVQLASTADSSRVHSWSTPANKKNGKVTWSQRVDRLPAQTLSTSDGVYSLRLLVAGQQGMDPLALELGQLTIPYLHNAKKSKADDARTARETEMGFRRWEEKRHTFRKEVTEGMPSAKKSVVVGVVLVVVPWLVLVGLLAPVITQSSLQLFPTSPKLPTSILFASLIFLEIIGLRYYKGDFVLFKMLPLFGVGSAVASIAVLAGGVRGVGLIGGGRATVKA